MFGQPGGGGMWPPLSGASGGPPVTANGVPGVPFNSLYSSLASAQAAAGNAHHLSQFVQPHPYQGPPQPQSMMQRQLGHSQLNPLSRGHHQTASMMLPPSSTNMRHVELQEKKKQEAEKRKRAEEERQKAAKASEEFFTKSSLFEEPTKISSSENEVANVLGKFDSAQQMLNLNSIGVDYQPPTPAVREHIIGDDDDAHPASMMAKPFNPANALYGSSMHPHRPNSNLNHRRPPSSSVPRPLPNQRLPENINQVYPPTSRPPGSHRGPQRPPMGPPNPHSINTFREPATAASSRLKEAGKSLKQLNLEKNKEHDISQIFSEMINPLGAAGSSESSMMPPPLSAIITPRVTKHEGNNARSVPKYFPTVSPPPSPIKPFKASPEHPPSAITANGQAKNDLMHAIPGFGNGPRLSEDSESDHEKQQLPTAAISFNPKFDPCVGVDMIERKPGQAGPTVPKTHHTTSESSESDSESSDDSSSDEDPSRTSGSKNKNSVKSATTLNKPPEVNIVPSSVEVNRDPGDVDFSLNNLLNKVKKHSPGPILSQSNVLPPEVNAEVIPELLSQERSPFSINSIPILGDKTMLDDKTTLLDISKPLSPLQGSPPASITSVPSRNKQRRTSSRSSTRSTRSARSSRTRNTSNSNPQFMDSSDDEPPTENRTVLPSKPTPPKPRKNALPDTKISRQDEDDLGDDLFQFEDNKKNKLRPSRSRSVKVPPKVPTKAPTKPTPSIISSNSKIHLSSSGAESEDDEDKPLSPTYKTKSPRKRKLTKSEAVEPAPSPKKEERKQKVAALSRIYPHPIKKSKEIKEIKDEDDFEAITEATAILKRTDGRPILICRIPFGLMKESKASKKRERKTSTSSTASTASKKHKKLEEVKPEATNLETLPGYGGSTSSSLRNLMPPPPDQKIEAVEEPPQILNSDKIQNSHNSVYVEDDFQIYMTQAKKLKHEADKDSNNRERQAMKYLEAVLYFILCGSTTETRGDHAAAYTMYKETLNLVRHVTRPMRSSESAISTDNKLAILSLRCQSLLYLKLYKLRKNELRECQQKLEDLLMNASKNGLNQTSPVGNGGGGSPTPSPAGSEGSVCSKSSGYTSSGELPMTSKYVGVLTPPSSNPGIAGGTMSVPHTLMQKQYNYSNYLTQCHELWEMAEVFTTRGHCSEFIAQLDQTYGMLTLHSSLKDLVKYTQAGLDYLAKERESIQRARRL